MEKKSDQYLLRTQTEKKKTKENKVRLNLAAY